MMGEARTRGWVVIKEDECNGCALCIEVCPAGCLSLGDAFNSQGYQPVRYAGDGCRADGFCFYACPEPGVISVYRGGPGDPR
jgi:NAD-dependent dihydropyrimidine dehydrogenase PreA subunit